MSSKGAKSKKKPIETTLGKASNKNEMDVALLKKPIETNVNGLQQAILLLNNATLEVKNYISYECDIMYECKVCKSIFRSLANFILHKRKFCSDQYYDFSNDSTLSEHGENNNDPIHLDISSNKSKDTSKDLTPIIKKLHEKQKIMEMECSTINEDLTDQIDSVQEERVNLKDQKIHLEPIDDNPTAVFQTMINSLKSSDGKSFIKTEVMEIHSILDNNEAVLGSDGKICNFNKEKSNLSNNLVCIKCQMRFSTKKTLRYHIKYKHNKTRMVFICPECKQSFANAWGVYRHLYKVHRKSIAQVRKMRNQINSSMVRRDQEPVQKPDKNLSEDIEKDVNDSENQWMSNFEGDNDLQMCGGCGKRFERKAALHSHSQMCLKRITICQNIKDNIKKKEHELEKELKAKKLQKLNSVKGSAKRKPNLIRTYKQSKKQNETDKDINENVGNKAEVQKEPDKNEEVDKTEIKPLSPKGTQFVGFSQEVNDGLPKIILELAQDAPKTLGADFKKEKIKVSKSIFKSLSETNVNDEYEISDLSCSILNSIKKSKRITTMKEKNKNKKRTYSVDIKTIPIECNNSDEDSNFLSIAAPFMNQKTLTCKSCQKNFDSETQLLWHMSAHFSWFRFQCSRCSFVSFSKFDCTDHAIKNHAVHRSLIPSVVLPIPNWKTVLMSHEFTPLTNNVDCKGKLTDEIISFRTDEIVNSLENKNCFEDSKHSVSNLFYDYCNIKTDDDVCSSDILTSPIKSEIIDITDTDEESFQVELPQEIYVFDEGTLLNEDLDIERVNGFDSGVSINIEQNDEEESFLPKFEAQKVPEVTDDGVKNKIVPPVDFCDIKLKSNVSHRPTRNRTKSKTLSSDFIYDLNKVLKLNDAATPSVKGKRNSKQKEEDSKTENSKKKKVVLG
ncbi:unnamed protein product [Brassicogethes aeneus]|uniref:C2H2-type domain-containing protein n=1 Tax=Brassicogethes aeneus TaxID=1431903 RepID=A0A9P0BAH5_BRAAE|nr:unnamed protein product [Brassicogethes aeneus]